ncbi:MAG TPA: nicotinate-nucleotide adenylyltransferase [Patescibacteria group bacterium]|nr:nicotinate-nucleotide adenylyltransferase [Patescibacteria group bacterium]
MARLTAIFGGTFDPVHLGHLRVALEISEALAADVRLLPAPVPPHRPQPLASAGQRMAMLELGLRGCTPLHADDRELRRDGPSYSVDTLAELRVELGPDAPLVLCVGADAFAGFATWHRYEDVFDLAHVLVLTRPGANDRVAWPEVLRAQAVARRGTLGQLREHAAGRIAELSVTPLAISATAVRTLIAAGRDPRFLVPDAVAEYIDAHRLYRSGSVRD